MVNMDKNRWPTTEAEMERNQQREAAMRHFGFIVAGLFLGLICLAIISGLIRGILYIWGV